MLNDHIAEKYIIASLLYGMDNRMPSYLEKGLTQDHFTDSYCKRIWGMLKKSYDAGRMHDAHSLDQIALSSGTTDAREFAQGIIEIRSRYQGDSYIEQHLKELQKRHFMREAHIHASAIQKACERGDPAKLEKLILNPVQPPASISRKDSRQNPQNLRNSQPFPSDAFPPAMREMIKEVALSSLVPESLAGMVALGVLSTAAGGGVNIRSRGEKTLNANLYILAIAKSGTGKGMTYSSIAKPLTDANRAQLEHWKSHTAPDIQADIELTEGRLKAEKGECMNSTKGDAKFKTLHMDLARLKESLANDEPRLIAGETTEQKLGMLISGQPHEAIGNHSAEARGLMQIILGKFSGKSNATGETIYLAGYSGDPYSIERAGRPDISLSNPCISCLFMIQPDIIKELMTKDSMSQSGFLPRFLMADVRADIEDEPETPHVITEGTSSAWEELIDATLDRYREAKEKITIEVNREAQAILRDDLNRVRSKGRTGAELDDLTSYVARYGENLRKIALLLHIGEHAETAHTHPVTEETARNACLVANWFFAESLGILRVNQIEKWHRLKTRLLEVVNAAGGQETIRQLRDRHTITEEEIEMITSMLPGDLEIVTEKKATGRPSKQVRLIKEVTQVSPVSP